MAYSFDTLVRITLRIDSHGNEDDIAPEVSP